MQPKVSIILINYKTPKLTKLCLRLLRKHTKNVPTEVIVIDNHSEDESIEYLRSLNWIHLIERTPEFDDTPPLSHSRALDLGLTHATAPYTLVMHTDTFVKNDQWLTYLLKHIESDETIAGVGSWKLEYQSPLKQFAKWMESKLQKPKGHKEQFLRSHCALYRTELLKKYNLSFAGNNECAGKYIHLKLIESGYQMIFLPAEQLSHYIEHANHATMVLNTDLGMKKRSIPKGKRRILKTLRALKADEILKDDSLDK